MGLIGLRILKAACTGCIGVYRGYRSYIGV